MADNDSKHVFDETKVSIAPDTSATADFTTEEAAAMNNSFVQTQAAAMTSGDRSGWAIKGLHRKPKVQIITTLGGLRTPEGGAIALGHHTGHFELDELVKATAVRLKEIECVPHAAHVSDPCDGVSQGTEGAFDSLPWRNYAAITMAQLIRSQRRHTGEPVEGIIGIASCDKGLPATLMALAKTKDSSGLVIPGGVSIPVEGKAENHGQVQSLPARLKAGEIALEHVNETICRSCGASGGGCTFLGTAATAQVVAEALGLTVPHSALAPSGQAVWRELGVRSADALKNMMDKDIKIRDVLTDDAIYNAMVVHAAMGGSTNLLLHIPAIAHEAGLKVPTMADWEAINKKVPRLVSVLPNGPVHYPTVNVYMAGGVPEVMVHLRDLGLLKLDCMTVNGKTVGENIAEWEKSSRRQNGKEKLRKDGTEPNDTRTTKGVDPDNVILSPSRAAEKGLTSTVVFPKGNIAPDASVVKSTSIDRELFDAEGIFYRKGPAKVFTSEKDAIQAITSKQIVAGDVIILIGVGPLGAGMPETFHITRALTDLKDAEGHKIGHHITLITDGRFSGVSTGACIGHVGPEGLAGGPIGKLRNNDRIEIVINRNTNDASINFVGEDGREFTCEEGDRILAQRSRNPELKQHSSLPPDVQLWAALQAAGGGTRIGCAFDVPVIVEHLDLGKLLSDQLPGVSRIEAEAILLAAKAAITQAASGQGDEMEVRMAKALLQVLTERGIKPDELAARMTGTRAC